MAKKSARKEITKINLKQAALEGISYERACETAKRAGKPSYRFTVGDKVQVGHLLNCVVDEALEGGYMYLIRSGANSDNYSCWAWTNVRPLDDDKDTHFAKRNSALSRLHYSNRSMYSLLSFQYLFGVDFNPDYQRGSVWDDEDREKLLDSIFMGREIGRFVFKQLPFTRTVRFLLGFLYFYDVDLTPGYQSRYAWNEARKVAYLADIFAGKDAGEIVFQEIPSSNPQPKYQLIKGEQEAITLREFYENRLLYKKACYNDIRADDIFWFRQTMLRMIVYNAKHEPSTEHEDIAIIGRILFGRY